MREVIEVFCNWFVGEYGDEFQFYKVGKGKVIRIEYNQPTAGLDQHYADVYFENGTIQRMFNINQITFKLKEVSKTKGE